MSVLTNQSMRIHCSTYVSGWCTRGHTVESFTSLHHMYLAPPFHMYLAPPFENPLNKDRSV